MRRPVSTLPAALGPAVPSPRLPLRVWHTRPSVSPFTAAFSMDVLCILGVGQALGPVLGVSGSDFPGLSPLLVSLVSPGGPTVRAGR